MLRGKWRHAYAILFFLVVASCSGGGCSSGCAGCGVTPLLQGFPASGDIPNAASARVTRAGLDFLAQNAGGLAESLLKSTGPGGVLQYPIPTTPLSFSALGATITATVCPSGPDPMSNPDSCEVDLELLQAGMPCDPSMTSCFNIDAAAPGYAVPSPAPGGTTLTEPSLVVSGTLRMRLQNLPVHVDLGSFPIVGDVSLDVTASIGTSFTCDTSTNTATSQYLSLPFVITLPLVADTIAPRVGYTKIDGPGVGVYLGLTSSDVNLCSDCGGVCGYIPGCSSLCDSALNGLVGAVFNYVEPTLVKQITSTVQNQLCTKAAATAPECPDGTTNVGGTCMYGPGNTTCLPLELGTEGHIDLSSALASISPGTFGALDFLFSAGGNMIPANLPASATGSPADDTPYPGHTPNGMTLGLLAGALPQPQSLCVPPFKNVPPTAIPIPDALKENAITPWAESGPPDFGIAIAQRFLDYAFGTVYNSGLLCLGVSTATTQQLSTGLLSLLVPSIKYLTFEEKSAAVAITTRPQAPPTVVVGNGTDLVKDPSLKISLKSFAVDFYVFSEDRFVRAFTYTADLTIPVNLTSTSAGLLPVIGSIGTANAVVTNSELMKDKPTDIATGITGVLGAAAGTLTGSLKAINLASSLASYGITLTIPPDGIRKVTQGTDAYLAIFGDLGLTTPMPLAEPHVALTKKTVDPTVLTLATYDAKRLPSLAVHLSSDAEGDAAVEYAYWIDEGARSAWSTDADLVVQNDAMFLQGHHVLHVTARRIGRPETEATTPASLPFTLDVLPPEITLSATAAGDATVSAWDFVTADADLVGRYQATDLYGKTGAWSPWAPLSSLAKIALAGAASSVTVEARDEEGNVGQVTIDLIRGRKDPGQVASSCGCSTPGSTSSGANASWAIGLGLLFVAGAVARRRARLATALGLAAVAMGGAVTEGCSCGASNGFTGDAGTDAPGHEGGMPPGPMCGATCDQPCSPALPPGLVGAYTSTAKAKDGTIWVAGYNDAAISKDFSGLYGDLVVGKYDPAKSSVLWQSVDGVPALPKGTCADNDPTGWRHGVTSSGDDVGLWTSIQMDANDHPIVSYYDATHQTLKFASSADGAKWKIHTVAEIKGADVGRYSKMLVVGGDPTIAFLIMEPGPGGKMRSKVEVATARTHTPASASDWQLEDAAVDDNGPCRSAFCTAPAVCIAASGTCETPVSGCKAACDGGVCVDSDGGPTCETPLAATYIDIYPNAFGDYITMADGPNGLGIVVYDRIDGLLEGVWKTGGAWKSQVIDGWTQPRKPSSGPDGGTGTDTGDVGVGASLFIAKNGDWHISYVNGTTEALQYITVPGGAKPTDYPEIVDDGLTLDGKPFPDGLHIVGDDSWIMVDDHGVVTIRYQDATSGTLRFATGAPTSGGKHSWSFHAVAQTGLFAGFFPHQLPGEAQVANWWRKTDPATGDISGNVSFVKPN